jgi:hypothetical protein
VLSWAELVALSIAILAAAAGPDLRPALDVRV